MEKGCNKKKNHFKGSNIIGVLIDKLICRITWLHNKIDNNYFIIETIEFF